MFIPESASKALHAKQPCFIKRFRFEYHRKFKSFTKIIPELKRQARRDNKSSEFRFRENV